MTIYIFDMDGTLTPARKAMTSEFAKEFLPWLKTHTAFIATGSDYKKVCEQMPKEIIKEFDGIYASMGNTLYKEDKLLYRKDIKYDDNLISDLEEFRKATKTAKKIINTNKKEVEWLQNQSLVKEYFSPRGTKLCQFRI